MRKIDINDMKPGVALIVDVYAENNAFIPLLRKGNVLTEYALARFKESGIVDAYVNDEEPKKEIITLKKSKQANPWAVLNIPYEKRQALVTPDLKKEAVSLLGDIFFTVTRLSAEDCGHVVEKLEIYVNHLINCICVNRDAKINIHDLHSDIDFIYHHSLGVTAVSIAIGHAMGIDYNGLVILAKCAMLHDIGKSSITSNILNKSIRLTDAEFEVMKNHSYLAYKLLSEKNICGEFERQVILYHHEKMDGTGYPYNLEGEKIPLFSKIISVADVFDAMTSMRPYRPGISPAETAEYIMSSANAAFDFNVVDAFVKKIEFYPVGCFLELSTGNVAMVVDIKNGLRPIVRIMETNTIVDLHSDRRYLNIVINKIIPPKDVVSALMK